MVTGVNQKKKKGLDQSREPDKTCSSTHLSSYLCILALFMVEVRWGRKKRRERKKRKKIRRRGREGGGGGRRRGGRVNIAN